MLVARLTTSSLGAGAGHPASEAGVVSVSTSSRAAAGLVSLGPGAGSGEAALEAGVVSAARLTTTSLGLAAGMVSVARLTTSSPGAGGLDKYIVSYG